MKIGIIETGQPPRGLQPAFGTYPGMFEALLGPSHAYETFDVKAGAYPPRIEACQAYVITGSAAGVYEPDVWIGELMAWLRQARGRAALVGVCFGHQIMAQAFGGQVIKSPKGWGVGLHRYEVAERDPWMDASPAIAIPVSHQDQVVELPPAARVLAGNAFNPYGLLAYADQPAISMQCHPEFSPAYATALIESRKEERLTAEEADAAVASLKAPNDNARAGGWIEAFLARAG